MISKNDLEDQQNHNVQEVHMRDNKFRMSRGGSLLLSGNPKWYEVAEHIATKIEVNPRILSTLKNAKSI